LVDADDEPWRALAGTWDRQEVQLLYSMLLAARPELGLAPDEHAALLMVAWRFFAFVKEPAPTSAVRPAPQALVDTARRAARVDVRPVVKLPVAAPPIEDFAAMERWCAWVSALVDSQAIHALVRELALQAQCVGVDDVLFMVQLRVRSESLVGDGLAAKLTEALRRHTDQEWRLNVSSGEVSDSMALREARRRERRHAHAEAMIRHDPLVQDLLAQFPGARIVPGSVQPLEPSA
jgi:DNA polymerase-3 subunit gamma/tau